MKRVVLDMQSVLYAKAIRRILAQDLDEYQVDIAKTPQETVERCKILHADVLIMEVTPFTPWQLLERMSLQAKVKKELPLCKYILLVDEKIDKEIMDNVKWSKQQGLIDGFLFTSVSESYLAAVVDSM
ncbi:MAG: response regulator transcription factor [Bacteroidales bacterium]|nr:response regulator transcription factor [Bacteroidales bacterium]